MRIAITDAGNAFDGLSTAFDSKDFDTVRAACMRVGDSGREISAILPGPDPQLTAALQRVVDDAATVEGDCRAMGPSSPDADYERLKVELSRLGDDIQNPGGH